MKTFAEGGLLFALILALGGCAFGGAVTSGTNTARPPATWPGPPQPGKDGSVSVQGFNEYVQTLPPSRRGGPKELALEFLQPRGKYQLTMATRPGGSTVTVIRDNLEDDSVRADRYVLNFALVTGGRVLLMDAHVSFRCQPGRGHQQYSARLCV
jgi:hypothetical protein